MFVYDIIKIHYVQNGYLPNYPYHLISTEEMCKGFLDLSSNYCYFMDNYTNINDSLKSEYDELLESIEYHINNTINNPNTYTIPDWVLSYMLGYVVCSTSDKLDIHDLLVLYNMDNISDTFTAELSLNCYNTSKRWLMRYTKDQLDHRPPTCFGEPHVIKSLRLQQLRGTI